MLIDAAGHIEVDSQTTVFGALPTDTIVVMERGNPCREQNEVPLGRLDRNRRHPNLWPADDLLEAVDLDGDGDLDLITCEEVADLGVIWYENPTLPIAEP